MIKIVIVIAAIWFSVALTFVLSLMRAAKKKWNP